MDPDDGTSPEISTLLGEINQSSNARQQLLKKWSEMNEGCNVLTYFTSFNAPVMIDDADRDIIECILQVMDSSKPLDLILSSPGGDPLAAERIINVCRAYSSSFRVIVPKLAKSAATMISFGANTILMGETSELGPIDPQITYMDQTGKYVTRSADSIIKGVASVIEQIKALAPNQNAAGLLSLLPPIDQPFLENCTVAQELSKDIAIRSLKITTFKRAPALKGEGTNNRSIEEKISMFLDPKITYSHGRPIMYQEAKKIGLNVELIKKSDPKWSHLLKIYTRSDFLVSTACVKLIESPDNNFVSQRAFQQKT